MVDRLVQPVQVPTKNDIVTNFVTRKKVLDNKDTDELRSVLAHFCSADLRPFSVVEGAGFQKRVGLLSCSRVVTYTCGRGLSADAETRSPHTSAR